MPFWVPLIFFFKRCLLYFSKSCWWDRVQNMLIFSRRCSTPLRAYKILQPEALVKTRGRGDCNCAILLAKRRVNSAYRELWETIYRLKKTIHGFVSSPLFTAFRLFLQKSELISFSWSQYALLTHQWTRILWMSHMIYFIQRYDSTKSIDNIMHAKPKCVNYCHMSILSISNHKHD